MDDVLDLLVLAESPLNVVRDENEREQTEHEQKMKVQYFDIILHFEGMLDKKVADFVRELPRVVGSVIDEAKELGLAASPQELIHRYTVT